MRIFLIAAIGLALFGCDSKKETSASSAPSANSAPTSVASSRQVSGPTVVSLVPACTDLMIGIGASDHLAGVSNFDDNTRPELTGLPKVGDYRSIDWEQLSRLRPNLMVVQFSEDK